VKCNIEKIEFRATKRENTMKMTSTTAKKVETKTRIELGAKVKRKKPKIAENHPVAEQPAKEPKET